MGDYRTTIVGASIIVQKFDDDDALIFEEAIHETEVLPYSDAVTLDFDGSERRMTPLEYDRCIASIVDSKPKFLFDLAEQQFNESKKYEL